MRELELHSQNTYQLQAGQSGVQILAQPRDFSHLISKTYTPALGSTKPPYSMGTGVLSRGKQLRHGADH